MKTHTGIPGGLVTSVEKYWPLGPCLISTRRVVAHLKAKHGPPPTVKQLTCPTCSKVFKLVKTMQEHMASHKGPFFCRVEGCNVGPFALPKHLNHHMEERNGFSARKE